MVVQQECQLSVIPPSSAKPNSFINASNDFGKSRGVFGSSSTNKNTSNKKFSYCHHTGHIIDVCWGKHDYPPGYPRYPGCPRFKNRDSSSSTNSAASVDPMERPTASSSPITLTQANYQSLMALIQQPNSASDATGTILSSPIAPISFKFLLIKKMVLTLVVYFLQQYTLHTQYFFHHP